MEVEVGIWIVALSTIYKVCCLTVGLASLYMGYRLFMAGIQGQAGDLEASVRDNKLVLKSAAPGTFFALFGTVIICMASTRPVSMNLDNGAKTEPVTHSKNVGSDEVSNHLDQHDATS